MQPNKLFAIVAIAVAALIGATHAEAACTRLAFSVNDYGKVGPTKDATNLLDKYIADWARQKGIKSYSVSKKDVSCELYLDVIVFDEYTCKASALVCWPRSPGKAGDTKAPGRPAAKGKSSG
jgi:hypothetical protein